MVEVRRTASWRTCVWRPRAEEVSRTRMLSEEMWLESTTREDRLPRLQGGGMMRRSRMELPRPWLRNTTISAPARGLGTLSHGVRQPT